MEMDTMKNRKSLMKSIIILSLLVVYNLVGAKQFSMG